MHADSWCAIFILLLHNSIRLSPNRLSVLFGTKYLSSFIFFVWRCIIARSRQLDLFLGTTIDLLCCMIRLTPVMNNCDCICKTVPNKCVKLRNSFNECSRCQSLEQCFESMSWVHKSIHNSLSKSGNSVKIVTTSVNLKLQATIWIWTAATTKKTRNIQINKRSKTIGLKKKLIGTVKFRTHKELIELQFDLEKR